MRKLVALMLTLVLCFGLTVGCKKKGSDAEPAPPDDQIQNTDNGGGDSGSGGGESK